jgi:hypothetical protein
MSNYSYIFLLFILSSVLTINAQERWKKLNGPMGAAVMGLYTQGDTLLVGTGWKNGKIYFSLNGGASWTKSNIDVQSDITDFIQTDGNSILASTINRTVYKSNDLINWTNVFQISNGGFFGLGKNSNGKIFAGSTRAIYESTNNGNSWSLSTRDFSWRAKKFVTIENYIFVGILAGGILRKEQNDNWVQLSPPSQDHFPFTDDINLYSHTLGFLYKSTDYGDTWSKLDTSDFFYGIIINIM